MADLDFTEQKSDPGLPRPVRKFAAWLGLVVMAGGLVVALGNVMWESRSHAADGAAEAKARYEANKAKIDGLDASIRVRLDGMQQNIDSLSRRGERIEDKIDRLIERR